jgi:cytochrome c-type biogenesis protein CcmE
VNPVRKRRIRLVTALTAAVLLAGGLVYTSLSAGSPAKTPTQLLAGADAGRSYQLTGKVADGSVQRRGDTLTFRVRDRDGTASVPVRYTGTVPDPFREGREVIVTVRRGDAGTFQGERDSLVTKCPSKFSAEPTT